jgi:peptide/nickel transport system substrate-binding protein
MKLQSRVKRAGLWTRIVLVALVVLLVASCATPTPEPVEEPATAVPESGGEEVEPSAPTEEPPDEPEPTEEPTEAPPEFAVETLRAAIVGDESTINPYTYVTGSPGWNLLMMQYDSLFTFDAAGEVQPWLVTDYEISEDGLTYTMELREDVSWHDGEPFTAEDVKFAYEYFVEYGEGRFARDLSDLASAEVTGDYQVSVTLSSVNPTFIRTALADVPILPQHIWEDIDNPTSRDWTIESNVGTGPYQLVEYEPDQFYRFEVFTDYFAGKPTVGELLVIRMADLSSALSALRTQEVDILFPNIPPEQKDLLSGVEGINIAQGPQFSTHMVLFDNQREPFDQRAVRRAIALALNRQEMVDTVFLGAGTPGSLGWIHPDQAVFNGDVETGYDPEQARALLEEAGIVDSDGDGIREFDGSPMSFEMVTPSNNPLRLRLAELAKSMLEEIGIAVQVASVEQTTWEDAVWPGFDITNGRNYEMAMWGWSAPTLATPSKVCWLIHSDPGAGFLNITGFESAEADEVCNELSTTTDSEERTELIKEVQEVIAEQVPFVVLLYPDGLFAYWGDVYDNYAFITGQGIVNKLSFLPESARP